MTLQEAIKTAAKFKRKNDTAYVNNDGGVLIQDVHYPFRWVPNLGDILADDYVVLESSIYKENKK